MTKVTFETATLADAIRKAVQVAPSKGQAFDKASGIVIEVNPDDPIPVVIRATNLDVFYMEWVDSVSVEGDKTVWRLPAKVFGGVMAGLPIQSKQLTLEEIFFNDNKMLQLKQDKKVAKFNLMQADYYPEWAAFDPDNLTIVPDIGGRLGMVDWATDKGSSDLGVLTGVHLDGERAIATDKFRFASVELPIASLSEPVTVPASILTQIIKRTGEVRMAVVDGQLHVMPDETTQIRAVTFGDDYPLVDRIMRRDQPNSVEFKKSAILETMKLAMNFAQADRNPLITLFVGKEQIAVFLAGSDVGNLGDIIEVPGQAQHPRIELRFTPKNIIEALDNAPSEQVRLCYDPQTPRRPVRVDGGSGFEAWIAMRAESKTEN